MASFFGAESNGVGANPLSISVPANTPEGAVLLAILANDVAGTEITPEEDGWEPLALYNAVDLTQQAYYRVATANEPASYSFSTSNTGIPIIGSIIAIAPGEGETDPIVAANTSTTSSATLATGNIANVEGPRVYIGAWACDSAFTVATPPSGMTAAHAPLTSDPALAVYYEVEPADEGNISRTLVWSAPEWLSSIAILVSFTAGSSASVGEGTLSAGASSISGSGSAFSSISGSGTLAAQAVALAGSGVVLNVRNLVLTQAQGRELRDEGGTPVDLNGIIYEWYDDPDSTEGEPADSGTFNTDENGEATVVLSNSSLADGHVGGLLLIHPSDPTIRGYYRVPVTLSQ